MDEPDMYDTTMVSEYAKEIFECMSELEVRSLLFFVPTSAKINSSFRRPSCPTQNIWMDRTTSPGKCARRWSTGSSRFTFVITCWQSHFITNQITFCRSHWASVTALGTFHHLHHPQFLPSPLLLNLLDIVGQRQRQ